MAKAARQPSSRFELSLLAILFILLSAVVLTANDCTALKSSLLMSDLGFTSPRSQEQRLCNLEQTAEKSRHTLGGAWDGSPDRNQTRPGAARKRHEV